MLDPALLPPRIGTKIERDENGCWLWNGAISSNGYGSVWLNGRVTSSHAAVYTILVGPVPEGLWLDHFHCDVRRCCNPEHVRPVTPRENILRGSAPVTLNAGKTACHNGHEYTPENTKWFTGWRSCRICSRENDRQWRRRNPTYVRPSRRRNDGKTRQV